MNPRRQATDNRSDQGRRQTRPAEDRSRQRRQPTATVREMLATARPEMGQLLGRPVEAVTAVARDEGGWRVAVEVIELERIPASTSVVGSYEARLDEEGHVLEYARTERYYKNRASEGDST